MPDMTSTDIALVKDSFNKIAPISDQAAALFYARLFELDPSLRQLFRGDMEIQQRKFMQMIGLAVSSLGCRDALAAAFGPLGARHARAGVRPEHYSTVGTAFLWTLEKNLGADFTPAVKSAWTSTYSLIANTMLEGARSQVAA